MVAIRQGWEVERVAPAEALFDVGCRAVLRRVAPQADGGYRIAAVGGERFRVLDVVVRPATTRRPTCRRGGVARRGGGRRGGGRRRRRARPPRRARGPGPAPTTWCLEVARGSMDLLARDVRGLFARYVAEVAALGSGRGRETDRNGEASGA